MGWASAKMGASRGGKQWHSHQQQHLKLSTPKMKVFWAVIMRRGGDVTVVRVGEELILIVQDWGVVGSNSWCHHLQQPQKWGYTKDKAGQSHCQERRILYLWMG